MAETRVKIIDATIENVSRYGARRTSMADVAKLAGVSRQTLYANFNSKEDLLAAAITRAVEQLLSQIETDWNTCSNLDQVLEKYFDHAVRKPFDLLQQHPDLTDLIRGVGATSSEVIKCAEIRKITALAHRLLIAKDRLGRSGTAPESVAELVVRSTVEFKFSAKDRGDLENLLSTLKTAVLVLLGEDICT